MPNFALGRTHRDSLILIDDAQVMDQTILKQLLTRTGQNSKCVVAGDHSQQVFGGSVDRTGFNSLIQAMTHNKVPYDKEVGYYEFSGRYNMRAKIVKIINQRWR